MTNTENEAEAGNGGFGYGRFDHEQFETEKGGNVFFKRITGITTFFGLGRREMWIKSKELCRNHCSEYRLGMFVVCLVILVSFLILINLSLKIGNGNQINNVQPIGNNEGV